MASGFRHDAAGFLVGEIVESNRDLMRAQHQGIAIWKTIRNDMKAIARAVGAEVSNNVRMSRPGAVPRAPSARTSGGNYVGGSRAVVAQPAVRGAPAQRSTVSRASRAVVVAQPRGSNGRFVAGQRPAGGGSGGSEGGGGGASSAGTFRRMNETLGKLASSLQAADNIDPTVNAMKEVKDVVSPLGRGLFSLFGRNAERKKEVWYRRILKALTPGTQKAQQQQNGGGFFGMGGGSGGMLGSLLGTAGGSAAGGLLGGLLGKGKGLLKGGAGPLRRIPLLGALLAGGGALASIFGGGTRDEKYKGVGEAGGMLAGGIAGAKLGALAGSLLGPIGTAVGGVIGGVGGAIFGEKFGAKVGEWTKTLVDSDIPGKVVEAWNVTTAAIGAAWGSLADDAKAAWGDITTKASEWLDSAKAGLDSVGKTMSDAGNAVNDWIKAKTGVDVKGAVGSAATSVGNAASLAWDATKGAASAGWSAAKGYGSQAIDMVKDSAAAMVPNTVKRAYSAGAAAAGQAKAGYDVARGTESAAGAPVGALQQGARAAGGSLGDLIAKGEGGYGSFNRGKAGDSRGVSMDFSNMTVGQIMAAQSLPKGDRDRLFAVGKYQVIPSTLKGAVASMGLKGDEKFTPELQERIFGEYLADKKRPAISGYIRGEHGDLASAQKAGAKEWASIADPSTGKSFYAGSGNNKASLSAEAFGGALGTARAQYKRLVTAGMDSKTAYQAVVVAGPPLPSLPSSRVPSAVPATIPKATEVREPATALNSGAGVGRGSINVSVTEAIGQNVGDRGIAHVVSGGLGVSGGW